MAWLQTYPTTTSRNHDAMGYPTQPFPMSKEHGYHGFTSLSKSHRKRPILACLIQNCAEDGNTYLAQVSTVQIYHNHFHFNAQTIVHEVGILQLVPQCAMIDYLGTLRCLKVFIHTLLFCTLSQGIMWLALVRCQSLLVLPLFNQPDTFFQVSA